MMVHCHNHLSCEIVMTTCHGVTPLYLCCTHRAFALLSGFIRRTSSTEIVGCLLCLLEQQFGSCQEEGDSAPVSTQERIAKYHWLLTVFCDAISSLGLLAKISDLLPRERCCMVSKGIVTFIMKLVTSSNPSSGQTVLVCCKVRMHISMLVFVPLGLCELTVRPSPYCNLPHPLL